MTARRRRGGGGYVTAESALVMPVVAFFALAMVWMITLGVSEVRAVDAARDTARSLARGDGLDRAVQAGRLSAPDGSQIEVSRSGEFADVTVTVRVRTPGWLLIPFPPVTLRATAVAPMEGADDG